MNHKRSRTMIEPLVVEQIPNFEDLTFIWCSACKHVHGVKDWYDSNFNCPSKKCNSTKGLPWEIVQGQNENLPKKPENGKYYNPGQGVIHD